jgi:hypothetical protein
LQRTDEDNQSEEDSISRPSMPDFSYSIFNAAQNSGKIPNHHQPSANINLFAESKQEKSRAPLLFEDEFNFEPSHGDSQEDDHAE